MNKDKQQKNEIARQAQQEQWNDLSNDPRSIDPNEISGKFKMPQNFYKRVMEMEKEVDTKRENCSEILIRQLIGLYSEAIEYFAFVEQEQRCMELQMRMQSILVRPYVLDCL